MNIQPLSMPKPHETGVGGGQDNANAERSMPLCAFVHAAFDNYPLIMLCVVRYEAPAK